LELSITLESNSIQSFEFSIKNFSKSFHHSIFNRIESSKVAIFTCFGALFDKDPSPKISHSHRIANFLASNLLSQIYFSIEIFPDLIMYKKLFISHSSYKSSQAFNS
jgi:hypothetical protein